MKHHFEKSIRLVAFDILKFYAIFLVLWGHSIQHFLSSNAYDEPVYRIIYSFHMPLFMMISGYFAPKSMLQSPISFFKRKFIQLLLPALSWIVVVDLIIYLYQIQFFTSDYSQWVVQFKATIVSIVHDFFAPNPYWFLKTCFFCYILAYCGSHSKLNRYLWMFITFLVSQYMLHFVNILQIDLLFPCFIIGMELKDNKKFYDFICKYYLVFGGIFLLLLCFWDEFNWTYEGFLKSLVMKYIHPSNPLCLILFHKLFALIIGISGSLAFIGLFCSLIPQGKTNRIISICSNWGQYTLGIYILQRSILERVMAKYILLDDLDFFVFNFVIAPLISFLTLILCVYIIKIMSKSPTLAFYFFGKSKK